MWNIGKLKILFARNLLSRMKKETFFSKAVSAPEVDRLHLLSNGSLLHNRLSLLSGSSKFVLVALYLALLALAY